jgi:PGF-pre-PGF domain-containing protein
VESNNKKGYLFIIAILSVFVTLLLSQNSLSSIVDTHSIISDNSAQVDPEIEKAFSSNFLTGAVTGIGEETVRVIVVLKEDELPSSKVNHIDTNDDLIGDTPDLEERKKDIQETQDKVLEDLTLKSDVEEDVAQQNELQLGVNEDTIETNSQDENLVIESDSYDFDLENQYENINGFSGTLTKNGLEKLKKNSLVERIEIDTPVSISLSSSIPLINAGDVWDFSINGYNITGVGETVCVIDTGIDYTHIALGNCNPVTYSFNGSTENLTTAVESAHNYANNADITYKINKTGYTNISLHFVNISLESQGAFDTTDRVIVSDQNNKTIAVYKGNLTDVWTPHASGDTLYVRLVTDGSVTDYGFYIDQIANGTSNMTMNWTDCRVADGWDFVNTDNDPMDDHGHGTHVSGIVASNDTLYRGVAPGANIVAMKVLDASGNGYFSDVNAAMDWCVSKRESLNISSISLSLGTSSFHSNSACDASYPSTTAAINTAVGVGIPVFIASGNDAQTNGLSAPSCIANATSVGSVSTSDSVVGSSNSAAILDLLAPGASITSTNDGGGFVGMGGTSMATPHVAGAAALITQYWSVAYNQNITVSQLVTKLKQTGIIVTDSKNSIQTPRINVLAAIQPFINYTSTSVANGTTIIVNSALVNVTSDVNVSVALLEWNYGNGTIQNFTMNQSSSTSFYYTMIGITTGDNTYSVYGNDSANTFGVSVTQTVTLDNTPPAVSFNSPSSGSNFTTELQVINVTVNDSNAYVDTVLFNITNGSSSIILTASNLSATFWNATIDVSTLAQEVHTLTVLANDTLGNVNSTEAITFTVDRTAPTVALISPENISSVNITTSNTLVTFNYNVTDVLLEVANCSLYINEILNQTNVSITKNITRNFTKNIGVGSYNWSIGCTDYLANSANSSIYLFNVTLIDPVVNLNAPVDNTNSSNSTVIFNCSATDNLGLVNMTLYGNWTGSWHANETNNLSGISNSTLFSKTLGDGNYIWNCLATNINPNTVFSSLNYTLTVDTIAPNISTVSSGSIGSSAATISWTTNENSNSSLNFGTNLSVLGTIQQSTSLVTSHSVALSSLSASTLYYYNITSCDTVGNCNTTGVYNFTTSAASSSSSSSSSGGSGGGGGGGAGISSTSTTTPSPTESSDVESTSSSGGGTGGAENPIAVEESALMQVIPGSSLGVSSQTQDVNVVGGQKIAILFSDPLLSVQGVDLKTQTDSQVSLTIQSLTSVPEGTPSLEGSYQYLEISPIGIEKDNIKSAQIVFSVEKSWLELNNYYYKTVQFHRFTDEQWEEVSTKLVSEDETSYVYRATPKGFSYFVATAHPKGESFFSTLSFSNLKLNWFVVAVGVLIVILLVLYFILKPKEE